MSVNKIIYGNTTLIDLTGDTATASDVASGKTFHGKDGSQTTGTFTPTPITPSSSAPAMTANSIYKPSDNGYAIDDYQPITPSVDNSGTYFPSGFVKMSSSGYAYQNKPSGLTETVLWTNPDPSSPSTGFAGQDVTLSDDITNYDYICVECCRNRTATTTLLKAYYKVSDYVTFTNTTTGTGVGTVAFNYNTSQTRAVRVFYYKTNTVLTFYNGILFSNAAGSSTNIVAIPTHIYGCK